MLEDLLQAVLEGADEDPMDLVGDALGGSGGLADKLGGILGGGAKSSSSGGIDIGGLLESVLGGGSAPHDRRATSSGQLDGLGGILGAILGGGGLSGNSFLEPIAESLAGKLGLPPEIAQVVISFVLSKLMSGMAGGAADAATGRSALPFPIPGTQPATSKGLDLDHLLEQMGSGEPVDAGYLRSSGVAEELAEQTGLDQEMAIKSLQEALGMLGGQAATQRKHVPQVKPGSLDDLLDSW